MIVTTLGVTIEGNTKFLGANQGDHLLCVYAEEFNYTCGSDKHKKKDCPRVPEYEINIHNSKRFKLGSAFVDSLT